MPSPDDKDANKDTTERTERAENSNDEEDSIVLSKNSYSLPISSIDRDVPFLGGVSETDTLLSFRARH